MNESSRFEELLLLWEEARSSGQDVDLGELCVDYPELESELRRRAEKLVAFEKLLDPGRTQTHDHGPVPESALGPPAIPGYDTIERIGRGGMGDVWAARNIALDQLRAVKLMRTGLLFGETSAKRFSREMQLQAKLDHPNILTIHETGFAEGKPFFAMPLIQGGSLSGRMKEFRDPMVAAALMEQVARGVHHAHQAGILHRDLKPSNILLHEDGRALVGDFGIATLWESTEPVGNDLLAETPLEGRGETVMTRTGDQIGTPPYMAPEQVRGDRHSFGPHTDVWALGVILYRLLTGQMPFGVEPREEVFRRIQEAGPTGVTQHTPALHPGFGAVVSRCLEKDPANRYPTALALADALAALIRPRERLTRRMIVPALGLWAIAMVLPTWAGGSEKPIPVRATGEEVRAVRVSGLLVQLRQGNPVELIGPNVEEPALWLVQGDGTKIYPEKLPSGGVALSSSGLSVWELLPEVPLPAYRLEAEIAQRASAASTVVGTTRVGVGWWGGGRPFQSGSQLWHASLSLAEFGSNAEHWSAQAGKQLGTRYLRLEVISRSPRAQYEQKEYSRDGWLSTYSQNGDSLTQPFRVISLDIRPGDASVQATPEEMPELELNRTHFDEAMAIWPRALAMFPDFADSPLEFDQRGSLRIFTQGSTLIVRRMRVVPLTD